MQTCERERELIPFKQYAASATGEMCWRELATFFHGIAYSSRLACPSLCLQAHDVSEGPGRHLSVGARSSTVGRREFPSAMPLLLLLRLVLFWALHETQCNAPAGGRLEGDHRAYCCGQVLLVVAARLASVRALLHPLGLQRHKRECQPAQVICISHTNISRFGGHKVTQAIKFS